MTRDDGVKVKGMDEAMMAKVCNDFYQISRFAKKCGFDGVMLHGGHGFLLQQFISPWTNHRTDQYGGSMANRSRFPKMILEACRKGIGEDGILELRFSAEDGVPGGMTIDDTVEFCKEIDGMADILHISNGLKWLGNQTKTFSSFLEPHGLNVEYAAKIKAAVKKSYVATIGGFNGPELAEKVIAEGKADFVEFGRQCFADPNMPNKHLMARKIVFAAVCAASTVIQDFANIQLIFHWIRKLALKRLPKYTRRCRWGSVLLTPKAASGFILILCRRHSQHIKSW